MNFVVGAAVGAATAYYCLTRFTCTEEEAALREIRAEWASVNQNRPHTE